LPKNGPPQKDGERKGADKEGAPEGGGGKKTERSIDGPRASKNKRKGKEILKKWE